MDNEPEFNDEIPVSDFIVKMKKRESESEYITKSIDFQPDNNYTDIEIMRPQSEIISPKGFSENTKNSMDENNNYKVTESLDKI